MNCSDPRKSFIKTFEGHFQPNSGIRKRQAVEKNLHIRPNDRFGVIIFLCRESQ